MATSAVPGAIAALLTILRASPALADVDIVDGPPMIDGSNSDLIAVGWAPSSEQVSDSVQDFAYAGARKRDESFTLVGWIDSWTGDDNVTAARTRAYELLAVLEDLVRATDAAPTAPTLNGTVQWAHLTHLRLDQNSSDQGMQASITWTLTCRARI